MTTAREFANDYAEADRPRIDFAWNGKHAAEFVDANQQFRWEVVAHCTNEPGKASQLLLEHLFLADAAWSKEAWGAPRHFGALAATLLQRGGEGSLSVFVAGLGASFDTYGACHHTMRLSPELAARLAIAARETSLASDDERTKGQLQLAAELFEKIQKGTASEGWLSLPPETPVRNVRVVWPRWYHKLWMKVSAWVKKRAT